MNEKCGKLQTNLSKAERGKRKGASKVTHVEPDNHILRQHFQTQVHALMKKCVFSETRNKWLLIFIYVLFWGDLWEMREMEKKAEIKTPAEIEMLVVGDGRRGRGRQKIGVDVKHRKIRKKDKEAKGNYK